jgi:hypothetical protein
MRSKTKFQKKGLLVASFSNLRDQMSDIATCTKLEKTVQWQIGSGLNLREKNSYDLSNEHHFYFSELLQRCFQLK